MSRVALALRAALYASGFVVVWIWLAVAVRPLDAALGDPLPLWLRPVGIVLALAGAALAITCIVLFVSAGRGTPAPFDAPRAFVASGPYRWVRNPMYLGGIAVMGGAGFWLRSPSLLLLALAAFGAAHIFVIVYEEPALADRFGSPYAAYRRRVRRWIPRRPAH